MRTLNVLLCCCPLVSALAMPAAAYKAKDNEICGETKHNVSHDITSGPNKGHYSCDATTCTQTQNGVLTGVVATHYDNCVAAFSGGAGSNMRPPTVGGAKLPPDQPPRFPTPPAIGVLK